MMMPWVFTISLSAANVKEATVNMRKRMAIFIFKIGLIFTISLL
jgi:hypothetical protein